MSYTLFISISIIPGLISAGIVSRYYYYNQVSSRYTFLPFDKLLERQISRKLLKTWGEKTIRRYKNTENLRLNSIWNALKTAAKANLPGKVYFFETDDWILQILPTGDLFISSQVINDIDDNDVKNILAHELAHILLQHPQENINYTKLTALIVGWLCKNNHHFTHKLKSYLLHPTYTSLQEKEANTLAKSYNPSFYNDFACEKFMNSNNTLIESGKT
jgi:Zn-dependent protease with chaperone function